MFSGLRCGLLSLSISVSAYAQENSSLTDVTVKAEKEVLVEQRDSSASPWRHVCASPCSFRPTGGEYRVIGVDVSPSKPFSIRGPGALAIDIGSAPLARRGMWIGGFGAGATVLGLVLMFASSGFAGASPNGVLRDEKVGMLGAGAVFAFGGVAALFYGGALYYNNASSNVSGPIGDLGKRTIGFAF